MSSTPTTCSPAPISTSPRRSEHAASERESKRAASSPSPPTRRRAWPRSRSPAGCSRSISTREPRTRSRQKGRCSTPGRIRPARGWRTSRGVRCASRISTAPRRHHRGPRPERVVGFSRVHRGRGDGTATRVLVVAGGRPSRGVPGRHHERRPLASHRPRGSVGQPDRTRVSGGRHRERRCGARGHRSRRRDEVPRLGPRELPVSRLGAMEGRTAAHVPRAVTRPALDAGARGRHDHARHAGRRRGPGRLVGRGGARVPRLGR